MSTIFYLLDGILVDTGQSHMRSAFIELIKGEKIEKIILTHHHEDHSGNAATAKQITNKPVFGHEITIKKLEKGFKILPYQKYLFGKAGHVQVERFPPIIESEHVRLIPIHTPGHSKDHTVFYNKEEGWLFSGDLYLGSRIRYFRADETITGTIESIKRILKLDFDTLFCAHHPKLYDGKKYLERKLDFLEHFSGEVSFLYQKGLSTKHIISAIGLKEASLVKLFTQGNVSLKNMVQTVISEAKMNNDFE